MTNLNLPFSTWKHNSWVDSFTAAQLTDIKPKHVFDIGCGDGFYGRLVKHFLPGTFVSGIDIHPKWIEYCNNLGCYHELTEGNIIELISTTRGELVIAGDVLEHLEEPDMLYVLDNLIKNFNHIIINSPLGFQAQEHEDPWEKHRCGLTKETFAPYKIIEFNSSDIMFNVLIEGNMNKTESFLNHDIVKTWGSYGNTGILQMAEHLDKIMSPDCSVLIVGTGYNEEQYTYWPKVLQSVWNCSIVYLEIFQPYIDKFTNREYPIIKGDIRNIDKVIDKNYDVILWLQGPEHVTHEELLPTLNKIFSVCNRGIMCSCPWGSFYDKQEAINNNTFEIHVQKSMGESSFGEEFKDYAIRYGGIEDSGNGQILIKRSKV